MDDRLKFTGSIRYDKAQNFDGNYSPGFVSLFGGECRHNSKQVLETQQHKINTSVSM
jgi:hypothetical protein